MLSVRDWSVLLAAIDVVANASVGETSLEAVPPVVCVSVKVTPVTVAAAPPVSRSVIEARYVTEPLLLCVTLAVKLSIVSVALATGDGDGAGDGVGEGVGAGAGAGADPVGEGAVGASSSSPPHAIGTNAASAATSRPDRMPEQENSFRMPRKVQSLSLCG
jgi:hypothetical protein